MLAETLSEIQNLGDLGLACLLCLVSDQHGIITTEKDRLDDVALGLNNHCTAAFDLSVATVDCANGLTLDDFRESVLVQPRTGYDLSLIHI